MSVTEVIYEWFMKNPPKGLNGQYGEKQIRGLQILIEETVGKEALEKEIGRMHKPKIEERPE